MSNANVVVSSVSLVKADTSCGTVGLYRERFKVVCRPVPSSLEMRELGYIGVSRGLVRVFYPLFEGRDGGFDRLMGLYDRECDGTYCFSVLLDKGSRKPLVGSLVVHYRGWMDVDRRLASGRLVSAEVVRARIEVERWCRGVVLGEVAYFEKSVVYGRAVVASGE